MIRSVSIKNFRCFEDLEIENLKSVNIFSGKNNVGKTSLLEAIFLSIGSHNPGLPLTIDRIRGVEQVVAKPEEIWGWLFNNHNTDSEIQISCTFSDNNSALLQIYFSSQEEASAPQLDLVQQDPSTGEPAQQTNANQLIMRYSMPDQQPITAKAWVKDGNIKLNFAEQQGLDGIFLSSRVGQAGDNAGRFSNLKQRREVEEILESLVWIEPRLTELALLAQGGKSVVAGDIGLDQLIPVSYMGEGFNKLLSIVLAIATYPGGVVVIDEIENGFHHSVLDNLWLVIFDMSKRFNTQLFVSTHSYECMQAAHAVASVEPDVHCGFQRLERNKDKIMSVAMDAESIENAFDAGFEIR